MRLSRFECYGFKSFADKTRIDFDAGMTAIVGPNGCGKSNVADAIRWVLGESSMRVLRGERLDDVIFKGTRDRKPLSVAEVTLSFADVRGTLDVDYEDLAVTRRVFRDGVSDFLINKVPCRLKDITDLFLDSGVGKDAYSVMEFKMVEQIISPNAAERRALFEQAAGIMRYRDRLKASKRKLEETEGNLERLADVVGEVEKNVRRLAYQVRKARRFRRLQAQIRFLEVRQARRRWDELAGEEAALAARERELSDRLAEAQAELGAKEAALAARRVEIDAGTATLRQAEEAWTRERGLVAGTERSVVVNRERQGAARRARERAERELRELTAALESAVEAAAARRQEAESLAEPLAAARERLQGGGRVVTELQEQEQALEQEVEKLRVETMARARARARLAQEQSALLARVESLEAQRRVEEERLEAAAAVRQTAAERVLELEQVLEEAREREAVAAESLETLAEREAQAAAALAEVRGGVEDLRGRRDGAQARLEVLQGLESRLEGYGRAVRELLAAAKRGGAEGGAGAAPVQGVLANWVEVAEGFEAAVEAVLGERLQAVLTSDAAGARAALERVLAQGWGRVALLPLELAGRNLRGAAASGSSPGSGGEGLIGPLAERVQVRDPRAAAVVRGLLEGVLVVTDLAAGLARLEAGADPGCTYVTPRGEVLLSGGLLLGGGAGGAHDAAESGRADAGSILGRRREISAAEELVERLEKALESARGEALAGEEKLRELKQLTVETRSQRDTARSEAHRLEVEMQRSRERRRAAEAESERATRLLAEHAARVLELSGKATAVSGEVEQEDAHGSAHSETLAEREATLTELRRKRRMMEQELGANRLAVTRLEAELRNLQAAEERERERREEAAARRERLQEETAESDTAQEELRAEALELEAELAAAMESEAVAAARAAELREAAAVEQEEVRVLERAAREARARHETLREELHRLEMDAVELRSSRAALRERVQQMHRLDLGDSAAVAEAQAEAAEAAAEAGDKSAAAALAEDDAKGDAGERTEAESGTETGAEAAAESGVTAAPGAAGDDQATCPADATDDSSADPEDAPEDDPEDAAALAERLESLRSALDRLGQVNVLAIEQHAEEAERLDFLTGQRDDLTAARDSLMETIDRVNKAAREAFTTTFAKIRENFRDLFSQLFTDGDADVFLEPGVDPLEAKIDIVARPGGKRPQKITLLSSGEKTMTAIALLFSLFRVRPSPFCLLDEIDAPLDDANVVRFVSMLGNFTRDTQFLVITHNKRTMEAAGSIFGVTMEEVGVSKVLSLRLDDRREIDEKALASLRGVSGATLEGEAG
jgi:chromosome segregation protein